MIKIAKIGKIKCQKIALDKSYSVRNGSSMRRPLIQYYLNKKLNMPDYLDGMLSIFNVIKTRNAINSLLNKDEILGNLSIDYQELMVCDTVDFHVDEKYKAGKDVSHYTVGVVLRGSGILYSNLRKDSYLTRGIDMNIEDKNDLKKCKKIELKRGEVFLINPNYLHAWKTIGRRPAVIYVSDCFLNKKMLEEMTAIQRY